MEPISNIDFYFMCLTHNWHYQTATDHRVYYAGQVAHERLLNHAPPGSSNRDIYDAFRSFHFSGPAFQSNRAPFPTCPIIGLNGEQVPPPAVS